MVASKLISTVISLTAEEKRRPLYDKYLPELLDFKERIEQYIYPKLTELFQKDSEQFDLAIKLRKAREEETDITLKNQFRRQALEQLKISISIPLEISALCIELAEMAAYVFDNGFQSARGDSQVGLSGAVSGLAGCIAIVRLNVLSYNSDEYQFVKSVLNEVDKFDSDYQRLRDISELKIDILKKEFEQKVPLFEGINGILNKYRGKLNVDIEMCVSDLQNLVWKNRHIIWKNKTPENLLEILRPQAVLRQCLGYDCFLTGRFGVTTESGEEMEVAGLIDQNTKFVAISTKFPEQTQKFTTAHELAHAILHEQPILHRDVPVDNSENRRTRDIHEIEADKFASVFLMPKKLVERVFFQIYDTKQFIISENSAFKFGGRNILELKKECRNLRGLSKKLASTTIYDGETFSSMAQIFGVSIEAMAIRIEELGLVAF